jgi:hypothetical protein
MMAVASPKRTGQHFIAANDMETYFISRRFVGCDYPVLAISPW